MRLADLSPHYDDLLVTAFPLLYRDRHMDPATGDSLMGWGFCCGDGWFALLWELSSQLEHGIARLPAEHHTIRAAQVKEKVGELRVYLNGPATPDMYALIEQATAASRHICDICGQPGRLITQGRWCVCCPIHEPT